MEGEAHLVGVIAASVAIDVFEPGSGGFVQIDAPRAGIVPAEGVTLRRLGGTTRDRRVRPITAAFLQYLTGPRATASFRQRGMLLVKETWPALPDPNTEP